MTPEFDGIAPHPDGVDPNDEIIHERAYVVRAYRKGFESMVLRGAVRDQKPPGLYLNGDPDPLTIHHMIVDLEIAVPSLDITAAKVVMETHPHSDCPRIEDHYGSLVGLSIARGFTHKIRELFGGPRGCTHTTALLQAMAPVAVQSLWSFHMAQTRAAGHANPYGTQGAREGAVLANLNTCHVWAEGSEHVESMLHGDEVEVPLWITKRSRELGRDPAMWRG